MSKCCPKPLITAFLVAFFLFLGTSNLYASSIVIEPSDGIDVILVIDTSGSMRTADPERITLEAATLFMDMMETRNSRIGIVGFSGDLHTVMPLTPISDPNVRDEIRRTVSQFTYQGWTDVGLAMRTAAEMLLDDPNPANSPMILLFTDGRIDMPDNWNNRGIDVSYQDAWWAVEAVGDFTPIYTIGLNYDGTINVEFLEEISRRSFGTSHIIDDAALLPQIFNEIFASHIRTSITEVASIVTDGENYTDIIVPIPSPFVAEANIIMLSSQPITNVRLYDPSGREVDFDEGIFTLTYANRYTMVKILEPMVGDWTLSVMGLPQDRITVNLIYNYTLDVSFSIVQLGAPGVFFDPGIPITVQAGFISPLPTSQILALFADSVAHLNIFDSDMTLLESIQMHYVGSAFAINFEPDPPQDVRINITVVHPYFEQTTVTVAINYDPELLAALVEEEAYVEETTVPETTTQPETTVAPTTTTLPATTVAPTTTVPPTTTYAPDIPEGDDINRNLLFIIIGVAVIIISLIVILVVMKKGGRKHIFQGHLELRALLEDGKYTVLEAPDLSTFAGQTALLEFLKVSLGTRVDRLLEANVPLGGIYIEPAATDNRPMLQLTGNNTCHIADIDGKPINQKKYLWEKDTLLVFSVEDSKTRVEITYRINEH